MPRAFSPEQKQLIIQRLIEQGARQFSNHGLKKTSVEELAAAAGISKAAFYLFFPSKEALFMEVVERAEQEFRCTILAAVDRPGPLARRRLAAILKEAFMQWRTVPILQVFNRSDYELIFTRVTSEQIQEHLVSDRRFFQDLIGRCRAAGIPIQIESEELSGLMYALFFISLHENDFGARSLSSTMEVMAEIVAAYCLGEINPQP